MCRPWKTSLDVERALVALGHADLLAAGGAMSVVGSLGRRDFAAFRVLHARELARLEAGLTRTLAPEKLAVRGRLRRLRGDLAGAREDLARAAAAAPGDARTLAWLGELTAIRAPKRALRLLERAARMASDDGTALMFLGQARLELLHPRRALRSFDAALERFARPPHSLLLLRAVALFQLGDFSGAAAAAERAASDDPTSPAAFVLLSRVRRRQGREAAALAACHRARDRDLDVGASFLLPRFGRDPWADPPRYLKRLDRAIARRPSALLFAERAELKRDPRVCLYGEALADYEEAARRAPEAAWVRALVGRARNNAQGGPAGLKDFDQAIALGPDSGWIRAWRGAAAARLGRVKDAHADFAAAEERMPWYPYIYAWRGALLVREERHSEASADLDRAVPLDPRYVFSRYERFKARLGQGDLDGAVEDLAAARRADPKFAWPATASARARLAKAARARPDLGWVRAWLGHALLAEGKTKRALAELNAAVRLLPREGDPRVWRGEASARLGRAAAARRDFERAARLSPRAWSAHKALSALFASQGRTGKALARMRRVTALAPTTATHLVERARLEADLGRPREALRSLTKALELDPRYAVARGLAARARWLLKDYAGAERDADAAIASSAAPAIAYIVRAALRGRRGDAGGQAQDFRRALELEPALFSAEERRAIHGAA